MRIYASLGLPAMQFKAWKARNKNLACYLGLHYRANLWQLLSLFFLWNLGFVREREEKMSTEN